jgi:hypothetical protein
MEILLSLVFPLAISGRLKIGEFEHVGDGDGPPIGGHAVSLIISDILRGDHRAAVPDDDHPGIENVVDRVIDKPNSKWLERLIVQLSDYIVVSHPQAL